MPNTKKVKMFLKEEEIPKPEFHEFFFEFENRYNVFDLKTERGFPFWDILRFDVFLELCYGNGITICEKHTLSNKFKKRLKISGRLLLSFFKLFFLQYQDFFLSESRTKDVKGFQYDSYFDQVSSLIGKNIYYELNSPTLKYSNYKRRVFDIRIIFRKLRVFKPSISEQEKINLNKIIDDIDCFFNQKMDYDKYKSLYEDFLFDYNFYHFLLKFKNIKRVFIVQRGVQKALFLAAKDLNIATFEFQHGDIVKSTLLYNYFSLENIDLNSISFSKYLLTFSQFWTDDKNIPSECIEIGSEKLSKTVEKSTFNKNIVIISSPSHFDVLKSIAIEISIKYPDYIILFKLHPIEYPLYTTYQNIFKNYTNISLIADRLDVLELMKICNDFVVVYSTVIYELIHNKKNIYIYKKVDYNKFENSFDIPNIFLFENIKDFSVRNEIESEIKYNKEFSVFFKKFNKDNFLNIINNQ
ncbi:hypothetical protein [Flavobacterium sp. PL02]|uniref:hypothetical protein n=1 Tax=Flavobacterium sp. PL02 TaxID=3088354 RepID=UPI002B237204|nr:hypothetical protein [Flavobacterium sp. PL02]MEA9413128.1 hypothetical protein [Flavobacterium sp. PL02]